MGQHSLAARPPQRVALSVLVTKILGDVLGMSDGSWDWVGPEVLGEPVGVRLARVGWELGAEDAWTGVVVGR